MEELKKEKKYGIIMKEKEVKINGGNSGNVKKEDYIEKQVDYIYVSMAYERRLCR